MSSEMSGKVEMWRDDIRKLCRYEGHRCDFRSLLEGIEQSMSALLARTEAGADGYDDGSGRVRDWRESDTRPQDASGDVVPVLFGRDADADWYVDAGTKSICVDVDFDPARQLSLILKQDGTVAWSIFVQEPDSSTTKATGPSVMNPGFYEALSYIAMQAKEAK